MPEGIGYLPGLERNITIEEVKTAKKKKAKKKKRKLKLPEAAAKTVERNKELAKDITNPTFGMTGAEAAAYFARKRKAGINPQ
jgi:hypothetical protein